MKWILIGSLILNGVLFYKLFNQSSELPPIERTIIETHQDNSSPKMKKNDPVHSSSGPEGKVQKKSKKSEKSTGPHSALEGTMMENDEYTILAEKMETEKNEYLLNELGLSENKIKQINKRKEDFYKEMNNFYMAHPDTEPTLIERRQMLDMEEDMMNDLQGLYGEKNWEKYQKFRKNYNKRQSSAEGEVNNPFIMMGL